MPESGEFKRKRGGARLNSGPKPHKIAASGKDALEFLRAVLADKTAPTATRTKAAVERF